MKRIFRLMKDKPYRTYHFLRMKWRNIPRFTDCKLRLNGLDLQIPDTASFLSTYKEIFVKKIYTFKSNSQTPYILDLGANIGLSVLYFKFLYPKAKVVALEADPKIFSYLKKNVHGNGFHDVELINKAAWYENTKLKFMQERGDGGRIALPRDPYTIEVDAVNITEFLSQREFDFLKIDIEGAEESVLPACKPYLQKLKFLFVEYHSKADQKQCLNQIIHLMSEAGFRINIHALDATHSDSPFIKPTLNSGFDLQLNIFGFRA